MLVLPVCLLFLQKPSMFDISREMGSSVALYSRKILIQTKAADILPKWLRFLRGVCWDRAEQAVELPQGVRRGAAFLSLALVFASLFRACSVFQGLWTVRIYP